MSVSRRKIITTYDYWKFVALSNSTCQLVNILTNKQLLQTYVFPLQELPWFSEWWRLTLKYFFQNNILFYSNMFWRVHTLDQFNTAISNRCGYRHQRFQEWIRTCGSVLFNHTSQVEIIFLHSCQQNVPRHINYIITTPTVHCKD